MSIADRTVPPRGQEPAAFLEAENRGGGAQEQEGFELIARATQALVWDWDLIHGTVTWASGTPSLFSVPPKTEKHHRAWASRVHPDDLRTAETTAQAAFESGAESWEHEYRFCRADGSYTHILERAFIVRDAQGRARRAVGAMQDVSHQKAADEATTRLAAIVTSATDAIVGKSLEGTVTSWNSSAERIFGYTKQEMVGSSIFRLIPEELHAAERELLDRVRRGERVDFPDTVRIRKDGARIAIAVTVSPICDASGRVIGASSIKRDITDQKRGAEELARREERYRSLVLATASIVWTGDPAGRFIEPQISWERYTGQLWEEHQGFGWLDAVHLDDRASLEAWWSQAREHGAIYETRTRVWSSAHQSHRHVIVRVAPVMADGSVREWVGTVTDVEDEWMAEERLRQVERMESVGRLAGGIAHEANNQMTVILGVGEFLLRELQNDRAREDIEHIRRAAQRTAAITQQLLAFSRRQVLQPQVVDLNGIVNRLEPILQRALGETSRVMRRLAPDLGRVKADPGQLEQVLLNLALNARDAMPEGGVLTVETANVRLEASHGSERGVSTMAPGMYALLVVSDTGLGMDRTTLSHIFEPFFTTKKVGDGTGLGLSTVYGIVKQSGGFIWVYSEPGQGTAFKIYLPLVPQTTASVVSESSDGVSGRGEVLLVVEDHPAVRAVLARCLSHRGYMVVEAGDGVEALEVTAGWSTPPALVIADVVMPRMGGKELRSRLIRRWPELPVLFISGYTGLDAVSRGLLEPNCDFLQKPLEPEVLVREVRRILLANQSNVS